MKINDTPWVYELMSICLDSRSLEKQSTWVFEFMWKSVYGGDWVAEEFVEQVNAYCARLLNIDPAKTS